MYRSYSAVFKLIFTSSACCLLCNTFRGEQWCNTHLCSLTGGEGSPVQRQWRKSDRVCTSLLPQGDLGWVHWQPSCMPEQWMRPQVAKCDMMCDWVYDNMWQMWHVTKCKNVTWPDRCNIHNLAKYTWHDASWQDTTQYTTSIANNHDDTRWRVTSTGHWADG